MTMRIPLPFLLLVVGLAGCGTARRTPTSTTVRDSVAVRYEERRVTVFDTIPVALPQESSAVQTLDTISHIETSVAESDAWITPGGVLHHTLTNKPSLPVVVPHDTVWITRDSIVFREREDIRQPQPEPKPSFMSRLRNSLGSMLMLIGAIALIVVGVRIILRRR